MTAPVRLRLVDVVDKKIALRSPVILSEAETSRSEVLREVEVEAFARQALLEFSISHRHVTCFTDRMSVFVSHL